MRCYLRLKTETVMFMDFLEIMLGVKSPWRKSLTTDQIVPFQLKKIDSDGLVVGEISKTKVKV